MPSTAAPSNVNHPRHSHALMHVLMFFTTFFWAANIVAGKLVLHTLNDMALAQVRATCGAILFVGGFFLWRGRPALKLTRPEWRFLALAAFFGITVNQIFFISGIDWTSAAHSGLIVALGPVMVLILACAMRLEALTVLKTVGALVALAGVGVLTAGKEAQGGGVTLLGDALLFLGGLAFAYYTILLKEVADRYSSLTLNALIFALGAIFLLPFSATSLVRVHWTKLPAETWWGIAFIVILGTFAAYLFYAFALTELAASRVAAFAYLQPAIAAGLGVWLLHESVTWRVVLGGAMILAGVYLAERERAGEELPAKS
ncbi:MAG: DMT family transporter [Deltaproteobacteria bacterium]